MSAGYEEMKHMEEHFGKMHDEIAGGHWCWEDKSGKENFNF